MEEKSYEDAWDGSLRKYIGQYMEQGLSSTVKKTCLCSMQLAYWTYAYVLHKSLDF